MLAFFACLLLAPAVLGKIDEGKYKMRITHVNPTTVRSYKVDFDENELERFEKTKAGEWTILFDKDFPGPWGTGEYETVKREMFEDLYEGTCNMWCKHPKALEVTLSDDHANRTTALLEEILECSELDADVLDPERGFYCNNDVQGNSECSPEVCMRNGLGYHCQDCPNVKVRFFCPNPEDRYCIINEVKSKRGMTGEQAKRMYLRQNLQKELGFRQAEDIMLKHELGMGKRVQKQDAQLEVETVKEEKKAVKDTLREGQLLEKLLKILKSEVH